MNVLSFNLCNSRSFIQMYEELGEFGQEFKPPSCHKNKNFDP